ncbi:cytochrome p450 3a10 [Stemphylium lycopersici]|uniref:Cytochrome p450 3a10 n=1 Tax=Stemphylium lycopersici TaxID=183478 RepID=A0A364MZC8_STELY|nr:cytochrome p450 3a10 [Stemphylium lycopersici]
MASRTSTPSRSRSSSNSSSSSDATMIDAPPQAPSRPARLRNPSHSTATHTTSQVRPSGTQPDPSFSLLLSLPRELRDRVYTFALVSNSPFWWPGKAPESVQNDHRNVSVSLLRANKQVYNESVDILYSQNKFLFTHPSDCNIFRVVASPASVNISSVYFRIKAKDIKLWTTYLGSKQGDRSLKSDLPKLKSLWVFLRCGLLGQHAGAVGGPGGALAQAQAAQAAQAALGQQMHALQQQVQSLTQAMTAQGAQAVGGGGNHAQPGGNQIPPPPPPAPAMPFLHFAQGALGLGGHHGHAPHHHGQAQHHHPPNPNPLAQHLQHAHMHQQFNVALNPQAMQVLNATANRQDANPLYSTFLRFEREMGLESLCLNLRDVYRPWLSKPSKSKSSRSTSSAVMECASKPPDNEPMTEVKIVCILHIPRRELEQLVAGYPEELSVDPKTQDARTRFRELHGVEQHGLSALDQLDPCSNPDFMAAISPCSTIPDAHGTIQPSLFHLLSCGHVVAIDEPDRRCGQNCHHATEWAAAAHNDKLYCEVCNGIPIDSYKIMNSPSNEFFPNPNPVLRRCLALSREVIVAALTLPARRVEDLLAPVFPVPQCRPHELLCGHRVCFRFRIFAILLKSTAISSPSLKQVSSDEVGGEGDSHGYSARRFDCDYDGPASFNQSHLTEAATRAAMGKQSTMTSRRSKKGQGGNPPSKSRKLQSAAPGPAATHSEEQPRLKLRLKESGGTPNPETTLTSNQSLDFEHELPLFLESSPPVTTRTGRTIYKPKYLDSVEIGDYERAFEANSEGIGNENCDLEPHVLSDSSYSSKKAQKCGDDSASNQQQRKRKGRPPKNAPSAELPLDTIDEEEEAPPSSDTLEDQSATTDDDDVYHVINVLNSTARTHLDLPPLPTAKGTDFPPPYTARTLTQLYIFCYDLKQWDACDLVADTWIRVFHAVRAKSEQNPLYQIWRANKALTRRKREAREAWSRGQDKPGEFDPNPRDYALTVSDPEMAFEVTSMNIKLLNTLYDNTDTACGARLLWADALALSGDQTEKAIDSADKRGIQLHPDLRFNIMQTSLRMVRRNLTLKIEESTEGAWCKRYHEHGKHERMCYREKAWRYNDGIADGGSVRGYAMGGDAEGEYLDARGDVVDREELEMMDAAMRAEEAAPRGLKRGFEDKDADMGAVKRVRFGEDGDAEGESEEG